ncbi:MAG: ABC transporter substrate-binding protein [Fusobacteriaceae bacterium]
MKKILLGMMLIVGAVTFSKTYQIGATQIVEHSVLDSIRLGFEKALKDNKISYKMDYKNAQGDMTTQQLIASQFGKNKKDLILVSSTPSAQAVANATKGIPILFGAVSDPVAAGITSNPYATGISDAIPPEKLIENIKKLFPKTKKIGIIYNTSEKNSEVNIAKIEPVAKKNGIEILKSGVTTLSEIPSAADVIVKKVDAIILLPDNLVVSAAPSIIEKAAAQNKPSFSMGYDSNQIMTMGVLLGISVDYSKLGYDLGLLAIRIFNGEDATKIKFTIPKEFPIIVNEGTAAKFKIDVTKVIK